jgi:glycosyltransferase involved in cell wall biosynthesis
VIAGYFAPLPPEPSGVADYAAALLHALPGVVRTGADGDVNLYHIGNNPLHRSMYEWALRRPGVVVLHDAVLHHFHLGALPRERYIEEFVYCYGGWYRGIAEELWNGRSRSAGNEVYFRFPMLRRLAETSRAMIVHNAMAARMVQRESPSTRVEIIPHLPLPMPAVDRVAVERWRASQGIAPSHTLFGVAGFLRESKRVQSVLRTFRRLQTIRDGVHLLLLGSASPDLERAIEHQTGLLREPHLPEPLFEERLAACDVGVNLRYPSAGESSGITTRWMQLGRPVLVSGGPENASLPDAGCPRVPTGLPEEDALLALMLWLANSFGTREACGRASSRWVEANLNLTAIARRFWLVLEECRS